MPKETPEEFKKRLDGEVDKYFNKEYETDAELAEIKAKAGVETDELSDDAIDKLAADADDMKKQMDVIIEQTKETDADLPDEKADQEDPLEGIHLGKLVKEIRGALRFGKRSPAIEALGDVSVDDMSKDGVPLPKSILKLFDGSVRKTLGFLEEGQLSQGGAVVPEQFINQVMMFDLMPPVMRSRAFNIQATTNVVKVPRIVETTRASNVHGGIAANWTAESGTITKSDPKWGQAVLTAKKLAMLTYVTNELLDDNVVGLNDLLVRMFSEALGWFEDKAFINGSGVHEPIGIRQSGAKLLTTITASTVFLVADACKMFADTMPGTESRLIWLMNPSLREPLPQMLSASGGDNIWYPRNILSIKDSPEPWRLLGAPIFWTEHMASFGTDEDIALIDPFNYLVMSRQDIRVAVSTDSRFETDETGYKLTSRSDGQNWATSTLTLADGSTTVSPVVVSNHA